MTQTIVKQKMIKYLEEDARVHLELLEKQSQAAQTQKQKQVIEEQKKEFIATNNELREALKEGQCFGLAVVHGGMDMVGYLSWWENALVHIANWDEKTASLDDAIKLANSPEDNENLRSIFNRAVNYIVPSHASDQSYFPNMSQKNILKPDGYVVTAPTSKLFPIPEEIKRSYFEIMGPDEKETTQTIQKRKIIAGNLAKEHLVEDLKNISNDVMILVHVANHTIRLYRDGENWVVYDSNYDHTKLSTIHREYENLSSAIDEVFRIMGPSITIEAVSLNEKAVIDFPEYDNYLKRSPINLVKNLGLNVIASTTPEVLPKLFSQINDTQEGQALLRAIIEALGQKGDYNANALQRIAQNAPAALHELFKHINGSLLGQSLLNTVFEVLAQDIAGITLMTILGSADVAFQELINRMDTPSNSRTHLENTQDPLINAKNAALLKFKEHVLKNAYQVTPDEINNFYKAFQVFQQLYHRRFIDTETAEFKTADQNLYTTLLNYFKDYQPNKKISADFKSTYLNLINPEEMIKNFLANTVASLLNSTEEKDVPVDRNKVYFDALMYILNRSAYPLDQINSLKIHFHFSDLIYFSGQYLQAHSDIGSASDNEMSEDNKLMLRYIRETFDSHEFKQFRKHLSTEPVLGKKVEELSADIKIVIQYLHDANIDNSDNLLKLQKLYRKHANIFIELAGMFEFLKEQNLLDKLDDNFFQFILHFVSVKIGVPALLYSEITATLDIDPDSLDILNLYVAYPAAREIMTFILACCSDDVDSVQKLLAEKPDLIAKQNYAGFRYATQVGNLEAMTLLFNAASPLQKKEMIDCIDYHEIFSATQNERSDIIKFLLDAADPSQKKAMIEENIKHNDFQFMAFAGKIEIVKCLYETADPIQKIAMIEANNFRAFHMADKQNCFDVIKYLLSESSVCFDYATTQHSAIVKKYISTHELEILHAKHDALRNQSDSDTEKEPELHAVSFHLETKEEPPSDTEPEPVDPPLTFKALQAAYQPQKPQTIEATVKSDVKNEAASTARPNVNDEEEAKHPSKRAGPGGKLGL